MALWRICRRAFAELDGEGARLYGGRWNSEGVPVVYASTSLALAALEYLVHLDVSMVPSDLVSVQLEVPADVSMEQVEPAALPIDWNATSDHPRCVDIGDDWIERAESCVLLVPSAVIPTSWNALLNPAHADTRRVTTVTQPFALDRRLV